MSVAAVQAWRAWVNTQTALVGPGNPLALGAFTTMEASPDSGAYAVGSRMSQATPGVVAEDGAVDVARISALIFAGTQQAAEDAAVAYASTVQALTGAPRPCGDTGVMVLVHDNLSGPQEVPVPSTGGEAYEYEVAADFWFAVA